jgi:hypothetical protein
MIYEIRATTTDVIIDGYTFTNTPVDIVKIPILQQSNFSELFDKVSDGSLTISFDSVDVTKPVKIISNLINLVEEVDLYNLTDNRALQIQYNLSVETGKRNGFFDYNDTTGAFSITADTWADLPNDGAGAFTNKNYPPSGVTELMDVSILIRNDYTINPNTNNAQLRFRYALGNGGGSYTLEKIIGRLDSGSGQDYRFSLAPDLIYMGDTNTRDNPIKIQVYCTSNATVTNAGSVIQVIKR